MGHNAPGCFNGLLSLFPRNKGLETRATIRDESENNTLSPNKSKSPQTNPSCAPALPCCYSIDPRDPHPWTLKSSEDTSPPPYGAQFRASIYRPELLDAIEKELTGLRNELRELDLKIHDHPEIAFHEFYAHDTLTKFMRSHGFEITPHLAGIKSAWRAEWSFGKDGRTLGINAEMDALPGIGHACGHNLIAVAGVAVALGAKAAMEAHHISGKIVLLGTPAEEGGGGKVLLLEKGAYDDMDVCLMCHPGPGPKDSVASGRSLATQPLTVEYFGHTFVLLLSLPLSSLVPSRPNLKFTHYHVYGHMPGTISAHAAVAPWEGQNALDAAVLAYNSISMLRQQMKPDCRVHGIIQGRDWAANIIPDYAKMQWIVRAPSYTELSPLVGRIRACIEAAGTAADCRIELSEGVAYYDLRPNSVLEQEFLITMKERYDRPSTQGDTSASTDFGNVTYALPALHPSFAIPTVPNGGNHTLEFTHSARTEEAHAAAIHVAKGLALVGLRVLDDEVFYLRAREAFEDMLGDRGTMATRKKQNI